MTVREYKESYLFSSLTRDHRINVICTEIPKFEIETDAVNGTIDEKQLIYRDKDVTVEFAPDEHYEIDKLVVDGKDAVPDKEPPATGETSSAGVAVAAAVISIVGTVFAVKRKRAGRC